MDMLTFAGVIALIGLLDRAKGVFGGLLSPYGAVAGALLCSLVLCLLSASCRLGALLHGLRARAERM